MTKFQKIQKQAAEHGIAIMKAGAKYHIYPALEDGTFLTEGFGGFEFGWARRLDALQDVLDQIIASPYLEQHITKSRKRHAAIMEAVKHMVVKPL